MSTRRLRWRAEVVGDRITLPEGRQVWVLLGTKGQLDVRVAGGAGSVFRKILFDDRHSGEVAGGDTMVLEFVDPLIVQRAEPLDITSAEQTHPFADEVPEEGFHILRLQSAALERHSVVVTNEGVVADLVAEHSPPASVVGDVDAVGHVVRDLLDELALIRFGADVGGRDEVDAVGVHLDGSTALLLNEDHHLTCETPGDCSDLLCCIAVVEPSPLTAKVAVGRVDDLLEGFLLAIERRPSCIIRLGLCLVFGLQAHLPKPRDDFWEDLQWVGTRGDLMGRDD